MKLWFSFSYKGQGLLSQRLSWKSSAEGLFWNHVFLLGNCSRARRKFLLGENDFRWISSLTVPWTMLMNAKRFLILLQLRWKFFQPNSHGSNLFSEFYINEVLELDFYYNANCTQFKIWYSWKRTGSDIIHPTFVVLSPNRYILYPNEKVDNLWNSIRSVGT